MIADDDFIREFQRRAGLVIDGWAGNSTLAKLDELLPVRVNTELPSDYSMMLARIESGNRPYVKAKTSSASGLFQFVKSTWLAEGGSWGGDPEKAFGGLTPPPEEQLQRVTALTKRNADLLRRSGVRITSASLYAAHFLGAVTAARVLHANRAERADLLAGQAATKANVSILLNRTAGQFHQWLEAKTGTKPNHQG